VLYYNSYFVVKKIVPILLLNEFMIKVDLAIRM